MGTDSITLTGDDARAWRNYRKLGKTPEELASLVNVDVASLEAAPDMVDQFLARRREAAAAIPNPLAPRPAA